MTESKKIYYKYTDSELKTILDQKPDKVFSLHELMLKDSIIRMVGPEAAQALEGSERLEQIVRELAYSGPMKFYFDYAERLVRQLYPDYVLTPAESEREISFPTSTA